MHWRITLLAFLVSLAQAGCATSPHRGFVGGATASAIYEMLPFQGGSMHVLADDINGDGFMDLAFTSHGGSFTQLFYQRGPRRFQRGPRLEGVGFHPNDMIRLPYPGRRLYLSNAEGMSKLLVMEATPDDGMVEVVRRQQTHPRAATVFHWPGWGLGLAVAPKFGSVLTLLKGFDPLTGAVQQQFDLDLTETYRNVMEVSAADIDGDGIDELLFLTHSKSILWVVRFPAQGGDPVAEQLWDLKSGHPYYVVPADLTGNGAPDLLIGHQAEAVISVLLNDGHGKFTLQRLDYPGGGVQRMVTAVDRDGARLLFVAGHGLLTLYRFPGSWQDGFAVRTVKLAGNQGMQSAALVDLDGDQWLDLALARAHKGFPGLLVYGPLWDNFPRFDAQWPMEQR